MIGVCCKQPMSVEKPIALLSILARGMLKCKGFSSFALWPVLLVAAAPMLAQSGPFEKLQTRIEEIERDLRPELGPVRLHRIEELEDSLGAPGGGVSVESPFRIYQVEQRRFFSDNGKILQQVPWGRKFPNYIVVSQDGERVYRLAGFGSEAEGNFRRFVTDYRLLAPHDPREAESRALFCAQVLFGAEPEQWILGEGQAKQMIANHFFSHSGEADRWWRIFRHQNTKTELNLTTVNGIDGAYLTRLPQFWAPIESESMPEIRELQIQVSRDGACQLIAPR
jgi:hypothetical protein